MAIGKKHAKPRTQSFAGRSAGGTRRRKAAGTEPVAAAAAAATPLAAKLQPAAPDYVMPAPPATPLGAIASTSPDPAPDAIIRLGAYLTIREAVPLRIELLERVDAVDLLALDASGVQKVDTAGLQVLLAFTRQRRAAAAETLWTGCSEALRKAAAALDLEGALGLPGGAMP